MVIHKIGTCRGCDTHTHVHTYTSLKVKANVDCHGEILNEEATRPEYQFISVHTCTSTLPDPVTGLIRLCEYNSWQPEEFGLYSVVFSFERIKPPSYMTT